MKRFIKLISCSAVMAALIISTQLCVMAADINTDTNVNSPAVSYPTVSDISPVAGARDDTVSGVSGVMNDITPYGTPNPQTGTQNLVIPGVVAMIAAATAAVTLAGKKK